MLTPKRYLSYQSLKIPLYSSAVSAGFPSPAEDDIEAYLNLNQLVIKNPPATFFVRAAGDSMNGVGIFDGDILVVDRSIPPREDRVVIAAIDGDLLVKVFREYGDKVYLLAANRGYPTLALSKEREIIFWGAVTTVVHPLTRSLIRKSLINTA